MSAGLQVYRLSDDSTFGNGAKYLIDGKGFLLPDGSIAASEYSDGEIRWFVEKSYWTPLLTPARLEILKLENVAFTASGGIVPHRRSVKLKIPERTTQYPWDNLLKCDHLSIYPGDINILQFATGRSYLERRKINEYLPCEIIVSIRANIVPSLCLEEGNESIPSRNLISYAMLLDGEVTLNKFIKDPYGMGGVKWDSKK